MVETLLSPWVSSAIFGVLGLATLVAVLVDRHRPLVLVGHVFHLGMASAMVVMAWRPLAGWATPVAVAFTLGALWFAALGAMQATGRIRRRALGGHGPWHQAGHAVTMLAMVWMVVSMSGANHQHVASGAARLPGILATAALLVTGALLLLELVECLRGARSLRRHAGDLIGSGGMSLAMAAACWSMALP